MPSADAQEPDLQDGDLLVGAIHSTDPSGTIPFGGRVWRVRNGQKAVFCETTPDSFDSGYSGVPQELMLDSQGRVVFLAPLANGQGVATFVRRYLPDNGEWQEVQALPFNGNPTDMVNAGGVTYIG